MDKYNEFLNNKIKLAPDAGLEVAAETLHSSLKPHQVDSILWAARKGRALVGSSFGLGKTRTQLELLRSIIERDEENWPADNRALIICPLGVKHQFTEEDGPALGMQVAYVRNDAEALHADTRYLITNYERVRDGHFSAEFLSSLTAVTLDEGSVLRSLGTKTHQTFADLLSPVAYRFVFTATPAPNQYTELLNYAQFLGVMDRGQALTRWFKRDSQKAGNLTLHAHHEADFWLWVSSWAPQAEFGDWSTKLLAEAYGGDEAEEKNARTGCMGCPVASKDVALENIVVRPQWAYLSPLLRLREVFERLRSEPSFRKRKLGGERDAKGKLVKRQQRKGPLTMDARRWGMQQVLAIQAECNAAATQQGRPLVDILNPEEVARIEELIAANTWPDKWTGEEPTADVMQDTTYANGSVWPVFDFLKSPVQ
ncbi:SNF2-related protein [Hymenobacter sp. 102]|uniref:SNF2-related protein n=1 Tax=Hymenobacter sp. 102 TaxID=3403152 RepID=UPI003CF8D3DA